MSVLVQAVITGELGERLRERSEVPVKRVGGQRSGERAPLLDLFLDGGGSEDRQDYKGGGGGSLRLRVCAWDLACSSYLATATVTKAIQMKRKTCLVRSGLFCLLHLFCLLYNSVAHQKLQQLGNKVGREIYKLEMD